MPNSVLPSHTTAATTGGIGAALREPNVPSAWPGSYVPNLSDWEPGDLILIEGVGVSGVVIQTGQAISGRAMALASGWSHAAVYVGSGMVVDATLTAGIQQQSLWNYVQHRAITVRRLQASVAVASPAGTSIAIAASRHVGKPYSLMQAVLGKLGWPASLAPDPNALYCSTFVGLVIAQATSVVLWSDPAFQPLFPGSIAVHPDLEKVQLHWRSI